MAQDNYTRQEFFDLILAEQGYINIRGIPYPKPKDDEAAIQRYFASFDGTDEYIKELEDQGLEVYYNCATFASNTVKREVHNIAFLKSFYVDIDCGPRKDYPNKKEGAQALKSFLETTGLPFPTIVDSGHGIHAYWVLHEAISYNEWKPVAMGLKAKLVELKFNVDFKVSGDGARILRVPGTCNTKDKENPIPVVIKHMAEPMSLEDFKALIPPMLTNVDRVKAAHGIQDELTRNLAGEENYPPSLFQRILNRSLKTTVQKVPVKTPFVDADGIERTQIKERVLEVCDGCPQIKHAYEERASLGDELWCAALSIANKCEDHEWAIQHLSEGHPEYDEYNTIVTAARFRGPRTCVEYQLGETKSLCDGCVHKGKINSPITLGSFIETATPEDNILKNIWHNGKKEFVEVEIPITYPRPYVRPKAGGVAFVGTPPKGLDADETEEVDEDIPETLLYECDIWVKDITYDPDAKFSLLVNLLLPQDGLYEFNVPMSLLEGKEGASLLQSWGITAMGNNMKQLQRYLMGWKKTLEKERKSSLARPNFGWHDNDRSFAIGNREVIIDGEIEYRPVSQATAETAAVYIPKGELAIWSDVANLYNTPGNEMRAFALFMGFGAPLIRFLIDGSLILHLTNAASGVGKSTIQRVIASIWGHPAKTMMNNNDTVNFKLHRFGIVRHMPLLVDEITNMDPAKASDFALEITHNRGKNRMNAQSNTERRNDIEWASACITSGNNSLYDIMRKYKSSVEGEMFRIIELTVPMDASLSKAESDYMFDRLLMENYGIAGERFMRHVVPNLEKVKERLIKMQQEFDASAGFGQKERFYSAGCAAAFVGAEIANELGLIDFDIERVKQWAVTTLGAVKQTVIDSSAEDSAEVLGRFLNEHVSHTLNLVGKTANMVNGVAATFVPTLTPRAGLAIRVMPDLGTMYIETGIFRNWCSDARIPFKSVLDDLVDRKIVLKPNVRQALGAGWHQGTMPVYSVMVDINALTAAQQRVDNSDEDI